MSKCLGRIFQKAQVADLWLRNIENKTRHELVQPTKDSLHMLLDPVTRQLGSLSKENHARDFWRILNKEVETCQELCGLNLGLCSLGRGGGA